MKIDNIRTTHQVVWALEMTILLLIMKAKPYKFQEKITCEGCETIDLDLFQVDEEIKWRKKYAWQDQS